MAKGYTRFRPRTADTAVPRVPTIVLPPRDAVDRSTAPLDTGGERRDRGRGIVRTRRRGSRPGIPAPNGSFTRASLPDHVYTAESAQDPAVGCARAAAPQSPPPSPPPANEQYRTGYQQGLKDTLATCEKNPSKNLAPDPNWQSGYDKGAEAALVSKHCTGS
ncbi:hypothetical protein ACFRSX_15750 [Streptomyces goshikiensis]|uniref:hypothetical protein n=1 Tax=Streptomyces TaxID=1883 RepID=UPI000C27A49C|nr:hypothetical protein [Streptomyces sp. CB02120-2]PJN19581.1 hypothetical protein CG724_04795 [Streptomyces sp. CB02120-2]